METQRTEYRVTVHHEDGSFWVDVEELPGCFAAGDTLDELWESLEESVGVYLSTPGARASVSLGGKQLVGEAEADETKFLVSL